MVLMVLWQGVFVSITAGATWCPMCRLIGFIGGIIWLYLGWFLFDKIRSMSVWGISVHLICGFGTLAGRFFGDFGRWILRFFHS